MKTLITQIVAAGFLMSGMAAYAGTVPAPGAIKTNYQSKTTVFNSERQRAVDALTAKMEANKPARFVKELKAVGPDGSYLPDQVFEVKDFYGDIDGPDGELWFYQGTIEYETIVHNEYFTEELPQSFEVSVYDSKMQLFATVKDKFVLQEDELRVRQVDVLPILTQKYFNQDDSYELAMSIVVNPMPYGVRSYTYVYSLGAARDEAGDDVPVKVLNGMVSDVLNASDGNGENVIMTFSREFNDAGLTEEEENEIFDPFAPDSETKRQNFWKYNLGNKIGMTCYAAADAEGNLVSVFDKETVYYQANGNQQDDPLAITMVRNGKPTIVYPYYEEVIYNPFYSNMDDMTQRQPNNLVVEIYEQPAVGQQFVLKQTTKIPVVKAPEEDVLCSYYAVGSFRYRDDVAFTGDVADFLITRRDYIAGSDTERQSFLAYNSDGTLKKVLFENANGYAPLADLEGFDPMELFVGIDGSSYVFNFVNLRTYETELTMSNGLMFEDEDEPDYMMANIQRTPTADGKSFMYVAEMRQPGYDDIHDISYLRVVWLNRDGSFDHFDQINMGNNVKYATLYLDGNALQPDFFHSDAKQEYMLLIKRDIVGGNTEEQLLIAQIADKENPAGKDLLLLGPNEAGVLMNITPMYGAQNRLSVTYGTTGSTSNLTTYYYNLPLDGATSGIEDVSSSVDGKLAVDGTVVKAEGLIEVYNMQGVCVAKAVGSVDLNGFAAGVYVARAGSASAKVAVR